MSTPRTPPSRHDRESVLDAAMRILDDHGLADVTMRRLAAALDVQPSALYWHFANKQTLLAAMASRVLATAPAPAPTDDPEHDVLAAARRLRDALLSHRDGAEIVLSTVALGLDASDLAAGLRRAFERLAAPQQADAAATVLLHYTLGHASLVQQRIQADSAGALASEVPMPTLSAEVTFDFGVRLLVRGVLAPSPRTPGL